MGAGVLSLHVLLLALAVLARCYPQHLPHLRRLLVVAPLSLLGCVLLVLPVGRLMPGLSALVREPLR